MKFFNSVEKGERGEELRKCIPSGGNRKSIPQEGEGREGMGR